MERAISKVIYLVFNDGSFIVKGYGYGVKVLPHLSLSRKGIGNITNRYWGRVRFSFRKKQGIRGIHTIPRVPLSATLM